jgi:NADH:ubiquinone oxidoreductase subunit F (NADH-binding)
MQNGTASGGDLALLEELARTVSETSLCGLGQSAPNPIKSTLRYYRSEYEAALRKSRPLMPLTEEGAG